MDMFDILASKLVLTDADYDAIRDLLEDQHLSVGLYGGKDTEGDQNLCSVAAVNVALFGVRTDVIPTCMSDVIGEWIIVVQDAMPSSIRNSSDWKSLLPLAAGTGRRREDQRRQVLLDWLNDVIVPRATRAALNEIRPYLDAIRRDSPSFDVEDVALIASAIPRHLTRETGTFRDFRTSPVWVAAWEDLNPCGVLKQLIDA